MAVELPPQLYNYFLGAVHLKVFDAVVEDSRLKQFLGKQRVVKYTRKCWSDSSHRRNWIKDLLESSAGYKIKVKTEKQQKV
jgi:nicotinic acid mononucleotide adenylyltransferase